MSRAAWQAGDVHLIHAHGTGTLAGDLAETRAIRQAFGSSADRIPVIATKPVTAHLLGAAGLAQAVLTVRIMQLGVIPPTANLRRADPACDLDYNPGGPRRHEARRSICLASGFGGAMAAVAMELQQ